MQRSYGPPPANSPPLHHPVPQHVSTVPMMRSPPPMASQNSYSGSPYGGSNGAMPSTPGVGAQFGQFGNYVNDQTAQMGFQIGQQAMARVGEGMEQSVGILTSRALPLSADQSLRVDTCVETLLQRDNALCTAKTAPCAFPVATQALVALPTVCRGSRQCGCCCLSA